MEGAGRHAADHECGRLHALHERRHRQVVSHRQDLRRKGGPMNILCAGAAQGLVRALQGVFLELTGAKVEGRFGAVGAMKEALLAAEPCDVMIVTAAMVADLQAERWLVQDSE